MGFKLQRRALDVASSTQSGKEEGPKEKLVCLSSGCTLLNLACTNSPYGAFPKGKYIFLVGDSSSGKTFLSMTCLAEAMADERFKHYRIIYDNVEDGMLMNVSKLFGRRVAERIEPPARDRTLKQDLFSSTIEEFYFNLDDAIKERKPFIYILDSMDGLSSKAEGEKFEAHKRVFRGKGTKKDEAGSYGDGKAKANSEGLRKALKGLRDTGSILIVISQTRDNIGFGFEKKTRSGGRALRFYATLEIWSSLNGSIKKVIQGKPRKIGINVDLKVKKNRVTGEETEVSTAIYPSYGIDDIGSCIDYLVSEGWWHAKDKTINARELEILAPRSKLIQRIEEEGLYRKLQKTVGQCWRSVKEACALKRTNRYGE